MQNPVSAIPVTSALGMLMRDPVWGLRCRLSLSLL